MPVAFHCTSRCRFVGQASLAKYGSKLDIVYDDPADTVAGGYQHVYYWNQTL